MNCNTTHYRANSSSVPGDPTKTFNIEIGSSFGPLHGKIWRIGNMGYNARPDCVMTTLSALEVVLSAEGHRSTRGGAVDAAWQVFREAGMA